MTTPVSHPWLAPTAMRIPQRPSPSLWLAMKKQLELKAKLPSCLLQHMVSGARVWYVPLCPKFYQSNSHTNIIQRVDPNRIFWQRNETAEPLPQNATESPDRPVSVHRPPSYNPEDGIRYISEEELRAQAAAEEAQNQVPLPTHPSERERARRTMQQRQSTRFATGGRGAYAGSGFAA